MPDLEDAIKDNLEDLANHLLDGAREDGEEFAQAVARDLKNVVELPEDERDDALAEIQEQFGLLMEKHRLRATNESIETMRKITKLAIDVAIAAI
jgi:tRNA threonylcarbamoyladenosine modification (KEOPS) complex Cgi121 subunit